MEIKFKSLQTYLGSGLLLSPIGLVADDMFASETESCKQENPSAFVSTYDRIQNREITPNAGPGVQGGKDVFIAADYLYWYVSEDGLNYAAAGVENLDFGSSNHFYPQQNRAGIKGRMTNGFKVTAGLDLDYGGWDTLARYTWIRVHSQHKHGYCYATADSGTSSAGNGPYYPMIEGNFNTYASEDLSNYGIQYSVTGAAGHWQLHFNVLDWEVGRSFFISPELILRPHIGLKGTWQKQWYDIEYTMLGVASPIFSSSTGLPVDYTYRDTAEIYTIYNLQKYIGVGSKIGLDSSWMISKCFSLFGELSASTMFGYFKDTRQDISDVFNANTDQPILQESTRINLAGRRHMVNAVLETQVGFRYDYSTYNDRHRLRIQAGWENQIWFNQNHFLANSLANEQGADLGFEGLNVSVRLDY